MLSTVSALGAQGVGAGRHDRASATLRYGIGITLGFGAVAAVLVQFIAPNVVGCSPPTPPSLRRARGICAGIFSTASLPGCISSFSGYFCAYGRSELSFIHNILSIVLVRVPGAYLTSKLFPDNLLPMGLATASGSLLSVIVCLVMYTVLKRKGSFGESDNAVGRNLSAWQRQKCVSAREAHFCVILDNQFIHRVQPVLAHLFQRGYQLGFILAGRLCRAICRRWSGRGRPPHRAQCAGHDGGQVIFALHRVDGQAFPSKTRKPGLGLLHIGGG